MSFASDGAPPPPPGWYPDPKNDEQQRYWDGAAWTDHTAPGTGAGAQGPGSSGHGGLGRGVGVPMDASTERTWAAAAHLSAYAAAFVAMSFLGPLIVYLLQKDQNPTVAEHAREALNFHLSLYIYGAISGVLTLVVVGFIGLAIVGVAFIVLPIVAGIKALNGEAFRYPATIRLVR